MGTDRKREEVAANLENMAARIELQDVMHEGGTPSEGTLDQTAAKRGASLRRDRRRP